VYVIDRLALADPLLARLPPEYTSDWRIGHPQRALPDGYFLSRVRQRNLIRDDDLAAYFDHLNAIVSGRLLSWPRLVEIWKMNTGQYNDLIDVQHYRYPELVTVPVDQLDGGAAFDFSESGVQIELGEVAHAEQVQVSMVGGADYRMAFYLGERLVGQQELALAGQAGSALQPFSVAVPVKAARRGFDRVHILPSLGSGPYSLGSFSIRKTGGG
jgi:arabinofuranosyltransferase